MKQGTFIIEFFYPDDLNAVNYLVRATDGRILKHAFNLEQLIEFLTSFESKAIKNEQEQNSKKVD